MKLTDDSLQSVQLVVTTFSISFDLNGLLRHLAENHDNVSKIPLNTHYSCKCLSHTGQTITPSTTPNKTSFEKEFL